MLSQIDYSDLPHHMILRTMLYIERGSEPGVFLEALLENNLVRSFNTADDVNFRIMAVWASFLYNKAPSDCWGSKAKVDKWIEAGGLEGHAKKVNG